ncbi:hypothetical protein [Desulfonatronum sp. SC1]|uniref:hypothetical protein n=1 Tax=Desulfonatronum sp. SC1 TaxID=2109626 RepID=UPI001304D8E1|nr:hypothetical protein [Desulfonatronum sp. SC1]
MNLLFTSSLFTNHRRRHRQILHPRPPRQNRRNPGNLETLTALGTAREVEAGRFIGQ